METNRKALYVPRFGSQSSQPDRNSKPNEQNRKQHRLSKNLKKVTPLPVEEGKGLEMSPCYLRKVQTKHFWKRSGALTSTVTVRAAEGGKSPRVKELPKGPMYDSFEFLTGNDRNRAKDKMCRVKREVLRTIRRMVEENRVIRERLLALSQMRQSK